MPNENIMGVPTRACINGFTKEDTERLKNALVKQILNDKTVVNVTEDGKIIIANDDGLFLSIDDSVIGLTKDSDDNVIPITVPYLPEDENENPLVPPSGTIMTSDNIAVDPRIVRTIGNQEVKGNKLFDNLHCNNTYIPQVIIETARSYTTANRHHGIKFFDTKDNALNEQGEVYTGVYGNYDYIGFRLANFSRTNFQQFEFRVYDDHCLVTAPSYLPVDGNNKPVALASNAIPTSANIAVDPRLVHTNNVDETIDGNKNFLKPIKLGDSNVTIGARTVNDVTTVYLAIGQDEKVIATYQDGTWN